MNRKVTRFAQTHNTDSTRSAKAAIVDFWPFFSCLILLLFSLSSPLSSRQEALFGSAVTFASPVSVGISGVRLIPYKVLYFSHAPTLRTVFGRASPFKDRSMRSASTMSLRSHHSVVRLAVGGNTLRHHRYWSWPSGTQVRKAATGTSYRMTDMSSIVRT